VSEYKRLGYWDFWNTYGTAVKAVDENLVSPVLASLGASVGDKWRWDANYYGFTIPTGQSFFVIFDVPQSTSIVQVEVHRIQGATSDVIGTVFVKLPRKTWGSPRKQLRHLLS